MRKSKGLLFGVLAIIVLIAVLSSMFGNPVKIERYDAIVTIDDNGDMTVVERWEMDYQTFMSVRFRDIEYAKYAEGYEEETGFIESGNNIADFDQSSASVRVWKEDIEVTNQVRIGYSFNGDLDELGNRIECLPSSSTCESIFVDVSPAGGLEGKVIFQYEFKIIGAITEYSDISELNWRLYEYMEGTIQESTVQVIFPDNNHSVEDIYVWGHGLSQGTIEIVSNSEVRMDMENVKKGEFLEFRILVPTDLFPNIMPYNIVNHESIEKQAIIDYEARLADETNRRIVIAQIILVLSFAVIAAMVGITAYVYKKYDKEYTPEFQGDYYRELPSEHTPAEMSFLYYFKKTNDEDVTATLLDLIRRKYIIMDYQGTGLTDKNADFVLRLDMNKKIEELKTHEYHIVNWFFNIIGDGKQVTTSQIEKYGKRGIKEAERFQREGKEFVRLVKKECEHQDFFEDGIVAAKGKALGFAFIPVVMLFLSFFAQSMYNIDNTIALILMMVTTAAYIMYVSTIKKRSINGNEVFTKWKAFRNFLTEFGNFEDYPMPGVIVWEHFLVYATSLKVADKVMEQLKVKLPMNEYTAQDSTFMGVGYRTSGFYYGYALGSFNRTFHTAKTNSIQTITSYHASKAGSTGRGGGFGGGSSFGGGGGGGRSR